MSAHSPARMPLGWCVPLGPSPMTNPASRSDQGGPTSRGLHSSTSQLNVTMFSRIRWVIEGFHCPKRIKVEVRSGRVEGSPCPPARPPWPTPWRRD
jgi:hypothetical protein